MTDLEQIIRRIVRDEIAAVKPANDAAPEFLSVREAADVARVSVYTVRRWVRSGELGNHSPSARLLIKRSELDALLDAAPARSASIEDRVKRRFG